MIEKVFALPGLGTTAVNATIRGDIPVLLGVVAVTVVIVVRGQPHDRRPERLVEPEGDAAVSDMPATPVPAAPARRNVLGLIVRNPLALTGLVVLLALISVALLAGSISPYEARAAVWSLAGEHAPDHGADASAPLIVDLDATLVGSHSDKEHAAATFKRGYGFHPLCAFVDHGSDGTGEPLKIELRAGNAGSNTAADHITVTGMRWPSCPRTGPGPDPGARCWSGSTAPGPPPHAYLDWLTGQRLSYSVGFSLPANTADLLALIPEDVWTPAYDAHDQIRDGAWVAELTHLLDLSGWPTGMRVIVRKERPHPGAQLRITDVDGLRVTAFATNTRAGGPGTQLPDLELRHRRRARCEDRIRISKDTGLMNLHDFNQNRIWCAVVALAVEITAWTQMLALTDHEARRWEPKRLRLRLFSVPATLARTGRQVLLHMAKRAPWADLVRDAIHRLRALAVPS